MKAKIRYGANVWMDFRGWIWPECPHGDVDLVFDVEHFSNQTVRLRAANFGGKPYGNGAPFAQLADIETELTTTTTEASDE